MSQGMRILTILPIAVLLLLPVALLLFLPVAASKSNEGNPSCGALLANLARNCGQPDRAPFESCCASIREFNDAFCFCQPASFQPAAQLSGDPYGFSARMETCNVTTPYARPVPSRHFSGGPDTCPFSTDTSPAAPDALGEVDADGAQCPNPAELRKLRENALDALDGLHLVDRSQRDADAFRGVVKELFHANAQLTSIGLTEIRGRENVEDFLLARMVGAFKWTTRERNHVVWSSPAQVSYTASLDDFRTRYAFVSFQACSDIITNLVVVEHGVMSALGSQFYHPEFSEDAFTEYNLSPSQFCERVLGACGERSPYGSEEECIEFTQALKTEKRVLCNKFDNDHVSLTALFGDTISCRYQYTLMARTSPEKYCPLLGKEGQLFCEDTKCPENYYGDMFAESGQQRFESSDGFSCSAKTGVCTDLWSDRDSPKPTPSAKD